MLTDFRQMPNHSRVWIYQASRRWSDSEKSLIETNLTEFLQSWTAHGNNLMASYDLPYHQFVVIALDETVHPATGCSIDKSFELIKTLGAKLNIDFFDRMQIAFWDENKGVFLIHSQKIKENIEKGNIHAETLTFNNLVNNLEQFRGQWKVPMKDTWLKKYLKPLAV
ncbi:MAG: hypothetical protein OHK0038_03060 [Flammeovirgaceae bacterium]